MQPNSKSFGGFLKMMRKRAGLTLRELEDKSGVSHSYLTLMENGKRGIPSVEIIAKLAEPLNVSLELLLLMAGHSASVFSFQPSAFDSDTPNDSNFVALYCIGVNVKRLRQAHGYCLEQLSQELEIDIQTLEKLEHGKYEPSLEKLNRICKFFNVDLDYLIYNHDNFVESDIWDLTDLLRTSSAIKTMKEMKDKFNQFIDDLPPDIYPYKSLDDDIIQIPIYGTIKAGYNYVAEQNIIGYTVASKKEVSDGEYFYLIVKGDSMIEEGIKDGFKVLVRKQNFVENGKIGVVIVNGDEATLKRVYYEGDKVILQASNKNVPPRILSISDVLIQGQVKSVVFDV